MLLNTGACCPIGEVNFPSRFSPTFGQFAASSLTAVKFPDISKFSRQKVTLQLVAGVGWAAATTQSVRPFSNRQTFPWKPSGNMV